MSLDEDRRNFIVGRLLSRGVEVSCYTSISYIDMWNQRAISLQHPTASRPSPYASPMQDLGTSYHTLATPLHTCVLRANLALFRHLVSMHKFNPNIPKFFTRAYPPLFVALSRQDPRMATVALASDAAIDHITPIMRVTALHTFLRQRVMGPGEAGST